MAAIGYRPSAVPPDEFKAPIKAEMPKWAKAIHDAGINHSAWPKRLVLPAIPEERRKPEDSHCPHGPQLPYLAHASGDAINAVLAAAGYNFRRLLAWLRFLLLTILIALGLAAQLKLA
jgi:hypothetical protein